jgi:hypothetical protein
MATRLAVLDSDPGVLEMFRRAGEGLGCEVFPALPDAPGGDGELAAIAPAVFTSPDERRAYLEAREPDSVLLLVAGDTDDAIIEGLSVRERASLGGVALKPLTPGRALPRLPST